jgi:hypothetical protein
MQGPGEHNGLLKCKTPGEAHGVGDATDKLPDQTSQTYDPRDLDEYDSIEIYGERSRFRDGGGPTALVSQRDNGGKGCVGTIERDREQDLLEAPGFAHR